MITLTSRKETLAYIFGSYSLSKYFEVELSDSQRLFMRKNYNKISVLGFCDKS